MGKKTLEIRCVELVPDHTGFHVFQCSRTATVMDGDKPHCTQHSDAKRKERLDKATARYNERISRELTPYVEIERLTAELREAKAEIDFLREILEEISGWRTDWHLGPDENVNLIRDYALAVLRGEPGEKEST